MFNEIKACHRWYKYDYDAYMYMSKYEGEKNPTLMKFVKITIADLFIRWWCDANDHYDCLEDCGRAGPDSGEIYLVCSNCGWNYQHTLY